RSSPVLVKGGGGDGCVGAMCKVRLRRGYLPGAGGARCWAADPLYVGCHNRGPRVWITPYPRADALLAARYGALLPALSSQPPASFLSDPATALAAVLLFDQLPRNLHRGDSQAFAYDPLARAITREALRRQWDKRLTAVE